MKVMLHNFDRRVTKAVQGWPERWRLPMQLATLIGQPIFTVGIGALVAGIGLGNAETKLLAAGLIVMATVGVGALAKLGFARDRPLTEYVAQMWFDTSSFPSGHAAGTAVAYGLVAYIALQTLAYPWQYFAASLLGLLIVMIGISRVYLGAHYPSDVIAGWLLGFIGLGVIIFIVQSVV